nr:immunoglobulin light chain junction region [Macaca mulatta]MPN87995.1 immunoglobulin light chain junction region [Macaca mulatta]MPN88922.1 immunoglobulin light chain junction region [Macaca mulatta]MPN89060.1 immunoglobulin light chain junction region [Macaca mulatta]MPN90462.1 immunoglobulin light chain junction region [Macaca mulatta]
CMQGIQFPLTC